MLFRPSLPFQRVAPVVHVLGLVILVWASLPAFATLPFLIYSPEMSFTDAYFETISGLTTTGATVISGLDTLPPSLNLWRHLLNWLGGMGIIVLAEAILPLLGIGGRQLLKAEAFRQRSLAPYGADPEVRGVLGLIILSCLGISAYVWQAGTYPDYLTALRFVSFNLVSLATDCGFVSTDFNTWPMFSTMWMLFLSCVAASSGSTGGGLKMIRAMIMVKQGWRELEHQLHPAARLPVKIGGHAVANEVVFAIQAFVMMYVATVVAATLVLLASGLDFVSALSGVIACINNAGPGLGEVGPATNYASLNDFQTWVLAVTMLLGRLELFTVFVLFTRAFWRS